MKRKLQFLSIVALTMLLGTQSGSAQSFTGGPFNGPHTISKTSIMILELEDFDLGNNEFGAVPASGSNPQTAAPNSGKVPYAYYNKDQGNQGTNLTYRTNTDVDISNDVVTTGGTANVVLSSVPAGEWQYYTIVVPSEDAGSYLAKVNYKSGSAGKSIEFRLFNPNTTATDGVLIDASTSTLLYTTTTLPATPTGAYQDFTTTAFDLPAGTWVFRVKFSSGTPNFDYISFVYNGPLGVNKFDNKSELKVYPSSSKDGRFNLTESAKWEVYSISGAKVKQGEGNLIDISSSAKGVYILKTDSVTKKIIFE